LSTAQRFNYPITGLHNLKNKGWRNMKGYSLLAGLLCLASPAFAGKDPSDYPLRVQLIQQSWTSRDLVRGEYRATGQGNVREGETIHAFDFSYDCAVSLTTTASNRAYPARWRKQGEKFLFWKKDMCWEELRYRRKCIPDLLFQWPPMS